MKFDVYFFDLDGTIANTYEGIRGGIRYAAQELGYPPLPEEKVATFIGPPLVDSFAREYHLTEEEALVMQEKYREYYVKTGVHEFRIFDGFSEMLQALKANGKELYVVTSKPTPQSEVIIKESGLAPYFTAVIGATLDGSISKKEDVIRHALTHFGISSDSIVMVGDTDNDILGAKKNHLPSIAVRYGFGTDQEIAAAKPDYIVDTPQEILAI